MIQYMRTESVAVSEKEKKRLKEVSADLLGTSQAPFGVIISALIEEYESENSTDN
ncbi:hypothetical protein PM025_06320 [Halorubrum ezzemoulense]|uniref:hypothetical protein n=1 Tax=Halorubrum ezzemoulense TaxID=337243 RepID=UPI00232F7512|nr:hypothetical protein [Halorubrum ezzemoulense]MDB2263761.1 hypothetical protein [Halorubrum ezzemoulense]